MNKKDRIKAIRNAFDLSQEEFGKRLGVTKAAISRLESGANRITEQMMKSIIREFNVNYIWLFDGTGDMLLDNEFCINDKIDRIMVGESEFHKNLIKMAVDLSVDELKVIEGILDKYIELKKEKAD